MSNRERWVVYPLLLFTFLMATRDDYVKPEHFDCASISCRSLVVTSMEGKAIVSLGPSEDEAGAVRVYGSRHPIRLPGTEAVAEKLRRPGHEIAEIGANDDGGYLRIFGARPGFDLQLGHDSTHRHSGLTAITVEDEYVVAPAEPSPQAFWGSVVPWPATAAVEEAEEADDGEADDGEADDGEGDSDSESSDGA